MAVLFAGVDPGLKGGIAVYDAETRQIAHCIKMPVVGTAVAGKLRSRIDRAALGGLIYWLAATVQVQMCAIEKVSGTAMRKDKTTGEMKVQAGGGELSFQAGIIIGFAMAYGLKHHEVEPARWKRATKTPAVKGAAVAHAMKLFPGQEALFRGPRGGALDGPAEAALMAKWMAESWRTL